MRAGPVSSSVRLLLASIHVYPVKSLGGVSVTEAQVDPWGLRHDRRWLVLLPDGTVLTARERHRMLGLTAAPLDGGIVLTGLDGSTLRVEEPAGAGLVPCALSRLESVRPAAAEANAWLSEQLGTDVRLGWLDDPRRRTVSAAHGGRPGDLLSLADAGPLLLTTTSSLRRLEEWIAAGAARDGVDPPPVPMSRFRPSVVLDGGFAPFAEDGWQRVRVGGVELRPGELCDRCVMTTIDARSFAGGKEPLRTLARHRRLNGKVYFGVRLIPATTGSIRVGDRVVAG